MSKDHTTVEMATKDPRTPVHSIELNDLEKVFGTPNSPKNEATPDVHTISNERRPGREALSSNSNGRLKHEDTELLPPTQPLLEPDKGRPTPPIAGPEVDDLGDDQPANTPYHGIDDGLLEPGDFKPNAHGNGDGTHHDGDGSQHSADGLGSDGKWPWQDADEPDYPYDGVNGIGTRFGVDDRPISPLPGSIPDVNTYQQKKNLAQGMMDLALLSANANQLRYVIESSAGHPYYYSSITFIALSIILQIGVGIGLIMNSRYNVKDDKDICKADKINNMTVLGVFLITIVNVFITSFSVAPTNVAVAVQVAGMTVQQAGVGAV